MLPHSVRFTGRAAYIRHVQAGVACGYATLLLAIGSPRLVMEALSERFTSRADLFAAPALSDVARSCRRGVAVPRAKHEKQEQKDLR